MVEAQRLDPACAMCYWGEAFALGSFLNGAMTVEKSRRAHASIRRAGQLAESNATPVERDLIAAAQHRYPGNYDPANRRIIDEAFAAATAEVYEKYPGHHEVGREERAQQR
jgi:hypothetical protein